MKFKLLLVFIIGLVVEQSFAQSSAYKQVSDTLLITQKINNIAADIETINSEFIQEKNLTFLYETIISSGILRYEKPDKLRLEYTSPFEYLLIMNDGRLFINSGETKTEYDLKSNKMFNQINDLIISSVQGDIINNPNYRTSFYEKIDTVMITLFPKQEELSKYIKNIDLFIGKMTLQFPVWK